MRDEINAYFDDILSKFQCGFCKSYSVQHCLLHIIEKVRKNRDSKGFFGVVHTDLFKACKDCILHEPLLAKPMLMVLIKYN